MSHKREQDDNMPKVHRVYFIGAGFSAGAGYPVGGDLVPKLINWLKKQQFPKEDRDRKRFILAATSQLLRRYLGVTLDLAEARAEDITRAFSHVDVAEFYSTAHALAEMPALFDGPRGADSLSQSPFSMSELYESLSAATRTYFLEIYENNALPDDMDCVLNSIDEKSHAIVNFNWDEEVDSLLSTWENDPTPDEDHMAYTLSGRKKYHYVHLKPHGSIGWYDVAQGIGNDDVYFIAADDERIGRAKRRILAYTENELPRDIDQDPHPKLACPPVIMPPTFAKRFEFVEQQQIWQDVLQVSTYADEFVFLGYSLPSDDFLTRAAIRRSLDRNGRVRSVKTVLIAKACDDAVSRRFISVFPEFHTDKDYLQWTFGGDNSEFWGNQCLAKLIEERLGSGNRSSRRPLSKKRASR